MDNSNAVAGAMVAVNGVIDKLELDTEVLSAEDKRFLAEYQTTLAAGDTKRRDDNRMIHIFKKYWSYHAGR
jgi:hypothetical protein